MRPALLLSVLPVAALSAACTPTAFPTFDFVGAGEAHVVARRGGEGDRAPYRYVVRREPSGTTATLRAVAMSRLRGYAAGDGGVVLRRTDSGPWKREAVPVTTRLHALHVADEEARGVTDGSETPVYAVGDGGVIVRRSRDGVWERETSGTTRDLHAVITYGERTYAAGDGGTLLERGAIGWHALATGTSANLRTIEGTVIAGLGGALVRCTATPPSSGTQLTCAPGPPAAGLDLFALAPIVSSQGLAAFGAPGVHLQLSPAGSWERAPHPLGDAVTVYAALLAPEDLLLAGSGGALGFVSPAGAHRAVVAGEPDLRALAYRGVDGFAVGDRGTIVHLRAEGVTRMFAVQQ